MTDILDLISFGIDSWAFIDFTTTEHATTALVNPKNHRLDGRSLVVEYASPDAVRRGGGGPRPKLDAPEGEARRGSSRRSERVGPRGLKHREKSDFDPKGQDRRTNNDRAWKGSREASAQVGAIATVHAAEVEAPRKKYGGSGTEGGGYKGVKGRSKPGAALALAKRESTAIVASQGKKITF